jgi:maltooligosyltrehalose trehalohydrolase
MAEPYLHRRLGAIVSEHTTRFRIWAPNQPALSIELLSTPDGSPHDHQLQAMQPTADGYFELELPQVLAGAQYQVVLADGTRRPDPVSRFQPAGVHSLSQVVDPTQYSWNDHNWSGIAKADLVIYELHLGTFTTAGTYRAAAARLPELRELGITAIELMPIAESAGAWNWGYDGVLFFAPRHTYGSPDDFRSLVDTAHQLGIAVILDVVYNHFGPEGNYFRDFGPYVSSKHSTAWGDAPNFDDEASSSRQPVRDYFTANISYWIDEFHLDGLRIDAIHCMSDESPVHIVSDLADTFDAIRKQSKRTLHLIAESNVYDAQMLQPRAGGGHGYDAEWCDDFLHSVFATLRPGEQMSQRIYSGDDLLPTLQRGYVFAGSLKVLRQRIPLEEDAQTADWGSLVYSIQNHDFIGNHPLGKRLHQLTSDDSHRAAAALLLLVPAIPMLFMGEEFAAPQPFYFFVDYGDDYLRQAVERGRKAEYPQHDWNAGVSSITPAAFNDSKLGQVSTGNLQTLHWYHRLIRLRKQWLETGLLAAGTFQAQWLKEHQTALLHYQHQSESVFVVVRLSHPFMQHAPLQLKLNGELLINQNCDVTDAGRQLHLRENGVAIGCGSVAS